MKKPKDCKGCKLYHSAGTNTTTSKYNYWCCKFGKQAYLAVGQCRSENSKQREK